MYLGCHLDTICLNNKKGNKYFLYDMEEGVITLVLSVLSDYLYSCSAEDRASFPRGVIRSRLFVALDLALSFSLLTDCWRNCATPETGGESAVPCCCLLPTRMEKGKSIQINKHTDY